MRTLPILTLVLLLASAPAVAGLATTETGIEFSYTDPTAASVSLAGEFNGWDMNATPMTNDGTGTWKVVVPLDPGRYEYKYVVNGGTWMADPDNPVTGGDYGNSIVEVGPDGSLVTTTAAAPPAQPSGTAVRSNTPLNTRVVIGGFFRMLLESTDDQMTDERLRIDRPQDQFNLDVTANLNESIWGSARLQVRTDTGDFNQVGTELYQAQAHFEADEFVARAFYNEEVYRTEDPFGLFDGGDLRGTMETEHRPFGQGRQGITLGLSPFGTQLSLMYADTYDEDIFGPEDRNRDTATDVLGGRWTADVGAGRVGLSYRGTFSDWWVNMDATGNTTPDNVQEFLDNRVRAPAEGDDWFELGNEEHFGAVDVAWPLPYDLTATGAFGYGWYQANWDVFNKGDIQGSGQTNGEVDLHIGNEAHYRGLLGLQYEQPDYTLGVDQELYYGLGMDANERSAAYRTQPSSMIEDIDRFALNGVTQPFVNPNNNDDLNVLLLGPTPERTTWRTHVRGSYRWRDFTFSLDFTRTYDDLQYADFFPDPSDPESVLEFDLERYEFRTQPTISYRPFDRGRHHVTLQAEVMEYSNPAELQFAGRQSLERQAGVQTGVGHLMKIESTEIVLNGRLPLEPTLEYPLDLRFDLRFVDYRGDGDDVTLTSSEGIALATATDTDDFFNPFASLVFIPTDNVEIELGYGVDPRFYDVVSPRGWDNGRFRFRENYLRTAGVDPFHPLAHIAAEHVLEDRTQFVVNALLRF